MPQTFYIENDEEIISVIGRLRRSSSEENYFVFPKRALVLQSIINLRLFQREAGKLGKRIIIVTQDEVGKALAERVGLATERYTDDFSRKSTHLELATPAQETIKSNSVRSQDIGSTDFYATPPVLESPALVASAPAQTLRIRNASPERQPSLNSKKSEVDQPALYKKMPIMQKSGAVELPSSRDPKDIQTTSQIERETRLKNFFSNERPVYTAPVLPKPIKKNDNKVSISSNKANKIFFLLGGLSLISLIGVGLVLFLPKAEIYIIPHKTIQNLDLQFDGSGDAGAGEGSVVLTRLIEKDEEVLFTVDTTGTSLGTAQKARGVVVLYNTYSADPQSLVATTRLETPDGKIFRLIEGVTIPGVTGGQPGAIEVSVIADQTGTDYNISGTIFTIPGFKGGPKFEKFSAKSTKAMSGGSASSGASQKVISKDDLEKAEKAGREKALEAYRATVNAELLPGEKISEESLDIVSRADGTLPLSGTPATSFEYKNTFHIRAFTFSEEAIQQKILSAGEEKIGETLFRPTSVVLTYGEAIPDFDKQTVRLKVHATVTSESVINQELFLEKILGKDKEGIDTALGSFPEIKRIEVLFKPRWFSATVPSSKSRVTLFVQSGEEQ